MITFTLVAILGVLLVIVLMNLFKKDPKPLPAPVRPVEDLANLKVTDARTGDVLSIAGAGDRMTDLDYTVDRGTRLEAGARTWVELSGPYLNRRVSLRVGGDEEVEVFLTPTRARSRWKISASAKTTWRRWTNARIRPTRSISTASPGCTG